MVEEYIQLYKFTTCICLYMPFSSKVSPPAILGEQATTIYILYTGMYQPCRVLRLEM